MKHNTLAKCLALCGLLLGLAGLFGPRALAAVPTSSASAASSASSASSAVSSAILKEQTEKSGASDLYRQTPSAARKLLEKLGIRELSRESLAKFTPAALFGTAFQKLKTAAQAPLKAAAAICGILLCCALLQTMKNSVGEKPLQNVFQLVCTLSVAAVLLTPVSQCVTLVSQTIGQSSDFILTCLPVFVGLTASSGHPASAAIGQGMLLIVSQVFSRISATTFVPMVHIFLAFCIVASISPGVRILPIATFARKAVEWCLGICMTIFIGILTVQSLISQAADSVTMKAAKFVVGSAVPVVGGTITDAINMVVGCASLLKTTVGAYAIVVLILAFLPPLLDCVLWTLTAEISVAVAEFLGITGIPELLKAVAQALKLLNALLLAAALTLIISLTVLLTLSSGS